MSAADARPARRDLAEVLELAGRREEAAVALRDALSRYERKGATAPADRVRDRLAALDPASTDVTGPGAGARAGGLCAPSEGDPFTRRETRGTSSREEGVADGAHDRARGVYAFGAGVVLNIFPGIFPLIALRNISSLSYGSGVKILLVIALYLVTFALIEIPLIGLLVAPAGVEPMVRGLNQWLDRNGKRVGIDILGIVGLFLLVPGAVQLVAG